PARRVAAHQQRGPVGETGGHDARGDLVEAESAQELTQRGRPEQATDDEQHGDLNAARRRPESADPDIAPQGAAVAGLGRARAHGEATPLLFSPMASAETGQSRAASTFPI